MSVSHGHSGPAITPALLFTFVFNSLLISARRRAYKAFPSPRPTRARRHRSGTFRHRIVEALHSILARLIIQTRGFTMRSNSPRIARSALVVVLVCSGCREHRHQVRTPRRSSDASQPQHGGYSTSRRRGFATISSTAGTGSWSLTSTTATGSSSASRPPGSTPKGKPLNVKGICANAATKKIYISTTKQLMCLDLVTEKLLWEKTYDRGCDRMSMTPDGRLIFLPSFEGPLWYVVRAERW